MIFNDFAMAAGRLFATDAMMMILSMMFGLLIGMLWTGRSFPRPLPRRKLRKLDLLRR